MKEKNKAQTMDDLKKMFIDDLTNHTERTIDHYELNIDLFLRYLKENGISSINQVTKEVVSNYQSYLYYYRKKDGAPLSQETKITRIRILKLFLSFLTKKGFILFDPSLKIKIPSCPQRLPKSIMTRREIERILDLPDTKTPLGLRDRCILELLYATGIRSLELRNLDLADLDLQAKILRVRCGKGGRDRLVPLGRMAVRFLKKYFDESRPRLVIGYR